MLSAIVQRFLQDAKQAQRHVRARGAVDLVGFEVNFDLLALRKIPTESAHRGSKTYELEVRFKVQRAWKRTVEE